MPKRQRKVRNVVREDESEPSGKKRKNSGDTSSWGWENSSNDDEDILQKIIDASEIEFDRPGYVHQSPVLYDGVPHDIYAPSTSAAGSGVSYAQSYDYEEEDNGRNWSNSSEESQSPASYPSSSSFSGRNVYRSMLTQPALYGAGQSNDSHTVADGLGLDAFAIGPENDTLLRRAIDFLEYEDQNKIKWRGTDVPLYDAFKEHSDRGRGEGQEQYGGRPDYRLWLIDRKEFKRLGAERAHYKLILEPPDPIMVLSYDEEEENMRRRIQAVIDTIQSTVQPQDWMGLTLNNKNFRKGPLWITARRSDQLDVRTVMSAFEKLFQSYDMTLFQDLFELTAIRIRMPQGSGLGSRMKPSLIGKSLEMFLKRKKRSLIYVRNQDDTCMARAIVLAKAYVDGDKILCDNLELNEKRQLEAAQQLLRTVGIPERPCTIEDMQKISGHYPEYRFMIRDMYDFLYKDKTYEDDSRKIIALFYDTERKHYHALKSLKGFLGCDYYCIECNVRYNDRNRHGCTRGCKVCSGGTGDCKKSENSDSILCNDCNRYCYNEVCLEEHIKRGVCGRLFRCKKCGVLIDVKKRCQLGGTARIDGALERHKCGEIYCKVCLAHFEPPHLCYMQPLHYRKKKMGFRQTKKRITLVEEDKGDDDDADADDTVGYDLIEESEMATMVNEDDKITGQKFLLMFYDFEATQETSFDNYTNSAAMMDAKEHCVNYAVVKQRCSECVSNDDLEECTTCGLRKHIFTGKDSLHGFLDHVFTLNATKRFRVIAIAHNSSGYDAQFILRHCLVNGVKPEKYIAVGTKIMSMMVNGVKFIDSFRFMPMSLSKLPDAFGFGESVSKGDFPHLFNRENNWNYVGEIPDFKYYGADNRSEKDKQKLLQWWTEQRRANYEFDFQKEIRRYCESDVEILERACLRFRDLFMRDGIDPFQEAVTIASTCSSLFRKRFLEPCTIGIMDPKGYAFRDRQSHSALVWLLWEEKKRGIRIESAANGREVVLQCNDGHRRYKADGYYAPERLVFEFQGCAFHGCPKCYRSSTARDKFVPNSNNRTMEMAFEDTKTRVHQLRAEGFTVVEKWECEFRNEINSDKDLARFWADNSDKKPLNPRDAFFGGRTNAIRLHYKVDSSRGETISYADVCSLYPWVNKYGKYPIGHPRIETSNLSCQIDAYEGLIKCKILPPKKLFHPVLPVRMDKRLFFPLCRTCAEQRPSHKKRCHHSDDERALTGTWVSDELKLAVAKGYRVVKMYEVWHFDEVRHGLFGPYIDHFLKMKTEASGYPASVNTEEEKDDYVKRYAEREGVQLDKTRIENNPGLRSVAKLALNSFWGKFGQRNNMSRVEYVTHSDQLRSFLTDETKEISSICFPSDDIAMLQWRDSEDFAETTISSNPFIAAYTTAQARMKLYSYLDELGDRVLYFDTDSIIYTTKRGQRQLPFGEFLGDLTNELAAYGPGAYIIEFVSAGPKNYAYTVVNADGEWIDGCCKVKGFTLNSKNAAAVNFHSMKSMVMKVGNIKNNIVVEDNDDDTITVSQDRISRTKDHHVVTRPENKTWRVVYDKRQIQPDLSTLPWGYK
jgi:G:T-mismatch repair DNA endonuclease (very short patch repair protein)